MFTGHKAKKAEQAYQEAMAHWTEQLNSYKQLIQIAQEFKGADSSELVLAPGEALFYQITGASLVQDRRQPGHYEGRSSGVSIPIGSLGGRTVRYRVGASRGHYVQGAPTPTAIDTGTVYVTNKRMIFQGRKQTRECAFAKLIGFSHNDAMGTTTFSVSNRQKPTSVRYGAALSGDFQFRLDLALAHYRSTVSEFRERLIKEANQIMAERPVPPGS